MWICFFPSTGVHQGHCLSHTQLNCLVDERTKFIYSNETVARCILNPPQTDPLSGSLDWILPHVITHVSALISRLILNVNISKKPQKNKVQRLLPKAM